MSGTEITLPGIKYIGPKNSIFDEIPEYPGDSTVREHDIKDAELDRLSEQQHWSRDKFDAELRKVDKETIDKFWAGDTWQEKVGAVGLTIKKYFQTQFGTKYPEFKGVGASSHSNDISLNESYVKPADPADNLIQRIQTTKTCRGLR